uniref:uncharacterized protein LOC124057672 n=1 Tax=Scatophagus argus TaxID=75038 RepID=UPI001ED7F897|nr:uncharacterized protein LOC124057672 [Scatophagus argus]
MLRIYICSRERDKVYHKDVSVLSDTSSDFEPTEVSPMKMGDPSRQSRQTPPQMTEVLDSSSHDDVGSHTGQTKSGLESEDDCVIFVSNEDADKLPSEESDFVLTLDNEETFDGSEIQFGPISGYDGDDLDSTLPWNPDDLSAMQHSSLNNGPDVLNRILQSPEQTEKEVQHVKLRRVNIFQDVLNVFMEPKVLKADLKMELNNEKAVDIDGGSCVV